MVVLAHIKQKVNSFSNLLKLKNNFFSSYLDKNTTVFLKSNTRNDVIQEIVDYTYEAGKIKNKDFFLKKVMQREKIVSTAIGLSIAIPHAKSNDIDDFFISIGIQKKHNIKWPSIDNLGVRLVFLIGGPDNRQNEYLQLLSKLTSFIKDEKVRKNLLKSNSKEDILTIFNQI